MTLTYAFGLDTFGDREGGADGTPLSHAQTIRNVVEEGVFAEQSGVDFFGIGEHHTDYFPMPAGDVALAAIAARTEKIRLGSAVTVLSSDDPVRVFQRYSTLDAISGGRAEVILGRGSSIESFPLFGYDLADYEELFEEKAALFAELLKGGPVTWDGKTRAPLLNQDVVPHVESGPFPAWIGVGGNPQSVIRAARLGFSLALAIIGGPPARFAAYSQLFQRALEKFGRPPLPVLVHSPGHVAATRRAGQSGILAALAGDHHPDRPGARLRDPHRGVLRHRNRAARSTVRRLTRNRRAEDRHEPPRPGSHPVRPEVRHAGPDPRPAHDHHRPIRPPGHPACPRTARLKASGLTAARSCGSMARYGRLRASQAIGGVFPGRWLPAPDPSRLPRRRAGPRTGRIPARPGADPRWRGRRPSRARIRPARRPSGRPPATASRSQIPPAPDTRRRRTPPAGSADRPATTRPRSAGHPPHYA